jgi:surface protein
MYQLQLLLNLKWEKTLKEAERIKKELINSTNPDLGLQSSDVEIKYIKEDEIYEITILDGRTVDYVEGKGAHVKNVSKVLEKDFYEYRRKGWLFTQPQGGSFRIGVPTHKVNEGFSFASFLSNKSQTTGKKEALAELDEDMAFKPKNKTELLKLLEKLIEERGDEGNFNDIDTSLITDMSELFRDSDFNGDISKWNVSNVTDMDGMFYEATSFNRNLSNWNVSNVTNMVGMFNEATSFNQDLSNWDVSNVKYMNSMFCEATSFNQDLSNWDVSNVTAMQYMFYLATSFNQDLSSWDVSNVTNMSRCFIGTPIEDKAKMWFPEFHV